MLLSSSVVQHFTQYIPLSVYELESWLGNPSIYVFDCSAAGMVVNAFCEVRLWSSGSFVLHAMWYTITLLALIPTLIHMSIRLCACKY